MTAPTIGERVRWRHGKRWHHGHLTATDASGALVVRDDHNGATHTLPAAGVEHEARGPRGGVRWQAVTPVATIKPRRKKSTRRTSAGQLALFEALPAEQVVLSVADFLDRLVPPDHVPRDLR